MDTAAQHTDMAEDYVKRWEPEEERDAKGDVYSELARILLADEHRDSLEWFDGSPVFPREFLRQEVPLKVCVEEVRKHSVPSGGAAGMCTQPTEVRG